MQIAAAPRTFSLRKPALAAAASILGFLSAFSFLAPDYVDTPVSAAGAVLSVVGIFRRPGGEDDLKRRIGGYVPDPASGFFGGFAGGVIGGFLIAVAYLYAGWELTADYGRIRILLQITLATALSLAAIGFLTAWAARAAVALSRRTADPLFVNRLTGAIAGGLLTGVLVGPLLGIYFGPLDIPEIWPIQILPGGLLGIYVGFLLIGFLDTPQTWKRLLRAMLACLGGVLVAGFLAGLYLVLFREHMQIHIIERLWHWNQGYGQLAIAGLYYGLYLGATSGIAVGVSLISFDRLEAPGPDLPRTRPSNEEGRG